MAVARTRTSKRSTARSRAAAVRQAAEDHNHRIMDALNRTMARIEFDLDGTVQDVNSNFLSVMGYTSDEVWPARQLCHLYPDYRVISSRLA